MSVHKHNLCSTMKAELLLVNWNKGTDHDFFLSETHTNHLQRPRKIHKNQKKQENPHKIAEIIKKRRMLAHFIL